MSDMKYIIWSNENLNIEDGWREAYAEFLEINGLDGDINDENAIYNFMIETNNEYLGDERSNLNIQMSQPILVIADLGRWNGRFSAYKEIASGNIRDCLSSEADYLTWFVDEEGDMRCTATHHDGTNYYLYRVYKDNVSEEERDDLKDKIYEGTVTMEDIERVTNRLGDEIGKVYGWDFPSVPNVKEDLSSKIEIAKTHQSVEQLMLAKISEELSRRCFDAVALSNLIPSGEDEKGAGGLWDLAADIATTVGLNMRQEHPELFNDNENVEAVYAEDYGQEFIYKHLCNIVERENKSNFISNKEAEL